MHLCVACGSSSGVAGIIQWVCALAAFVHLSAHMQCQALPGMSLRFCHHPWFGAPCACRREKATEASEGKTAAAKIEAVTKLEAEFDVGNAQRR